MADLINPVRYPTLYRYHANLPQGLDSYPTILSSAGVADAPRHFFGDQLKRDDLPEGVKALLARPWPKNTWVPEVHFMTIMALVRDIIHRSDEKYLQYIYDAMRQQFSGPLMRSVMFVVSPAVLGLATERNWNAFKKGVPMKTLSSTPQGKVLGITYPPKLYLPSMLEGIGKSIEAAMSCTRATTFAVKTEIISDQECHFIASWVF
jgi:hypothetical protein